MGEVGGSQLVAIGHPSFDDKTETLIKCYGPFVRFAGHQLDAKDIFPVFFYFVQNAHEKGLANPQPLIVGVNGDGQIA